jgi:hypothetical protein
MLKGIRFEVRDVLTNGERGLILGSRASKISRTGRIVTTDFAIVLTVVNGENRPISNAGRQRRYPALLDQQIGVSAVNNRGTHAITPV